MVLDHETRLVYHSRWFSLPGPLSFAFRGNNPPLLFALKEKPMFADTGKENGCKEKEPCLARMIELA
jgi:hypothetical protein